MINLMSDIHIKRLLEIFSRSLFMCMVRLAGFEPAHPVPETGALSPEL